MLQYFIVAALGAAAGLSELLGRYRDAPFSALRNWATVLLAAINSIASMIALAVVQGSNILVFPPWVGTGGEVAAKVLISGLGAMALLRVGISVQVAGETINLSISNLLSPILRAADNHVDRARAAHKLAICSELLKGFRAQDVLRDLPPLCLYLMQSIPEEDQRRLALDVKTLSEQNLADDIKLISLGSTLLNTVGESVLRSAVGALKSRDPAAGIVPS